MKIKKILLSLSLITCSYSASADTDGKTTHAIAPSDYVIKKVFEKDNTLHVVLDLSYEKKMHGMLDDDEQSIERSTTEGAALQFFIPHSGIEKAQVDKIALVQQVDDFVARSAQYFKLHPNYKGMFVVNFVIFPGYKTPFQVDVSKINDPERKKAAIEFNKGIKEGTRCNKDHFCQATGLMRASFLDEQGNDQPFDKEDMGNFLNQHKGPLIDTYTRDKNYLSPIPYYLYIGTNGFLITKEQMQVQLQKVKKEIGVN